MSRRHYSQRARHLRSEGEQRVILTGRPDYNNAASIAPPPLVEGKLRCPVCRNVVTPTPVSGRLRKHRDLFGNDCWNKSPEADIKPTPAPPVVIHDAPSRTRKATPASPSAPAKSRLDVGSLCAECGKWIPGERSLCGRCYATTRRF